MIAPVELMQLCAVVVIVTVALEAVQWLIIFRKPQFQSLKQRLTLQHDKPETTPSVKSTDSARVKRKQERLSNQNTQEVTKLFSSINFWTKGIGAVFMFATYRLVSRWLDNVVVAKLPFEPKGWFKTLTHRQLDGTDWTAASVTFMFTLCTMSLKANMTQWLQWGPNRAMTKVMMKNQKRMWETSQDHAKKLFGEPK